MPSYLEKHLYNTAFIILKKNHSFYYIQSFAVDTLASYNLPS